MGNVVGLLQHQVRQAARATGTSDLCGPPSNVHTLILGQAHNFSQAKAGITREVGEHMTEHSKVLSKGRKKRVMPEGLATVDEIEKLGLLSSHPLHKSTKVGASLPP